MNIYKHQETFFQKTFRNYFKKKFKALKIINRKNNKKLVIYVSRYSN